MGLSKNKLDPSVQSIAEAAVIGIADEEAGEVPKAFVVRNANLTLDEVIAFVAERVAPTRRYAPSSFWTSCRSR